MMKKTIQKWKSRVVLSVLLSCLFMSMQAQKIVTGVVSDSNSETLIGATVRLVGTTNATITDIDGKYSITVLDGDGTLEFSYVGYKSHSEKINNRSVIDVILQEDAHMIDEVVVVGYGVQKKSSMTSAVSALKGDDLIKAPSTNVSSLLGGRLPGVSSVQESGEPGVDQAALRVRGSQYEVKYIVDGMPRSINDIDPNDIESVSVLKDGAAAAIYGLEAAGGVVIITTKRGKKGKPQLTYNGSFGVSMNANFPKFMNGPQFAHYYNMADMMDQFANGVITDREQYIPIFTEEDIALMKNNDPRDGFDNVDYIDEVFGNGTNQKHSVTLQGGTDNMNYFVSLGYLKQEGNIDKFNYRRYNMRANINADITKDFSVSVGVAGNVGRRQTPGYSAGGSEQWEQAGWLSVARQTIAMHPYLPKTYEDPDTQKIMYTGVPMRNNTALAQSPLAAIYESGYKRTRSSDIQTNITLEYKLPWVKGLSAKATGSYDYATSHNKNLDTPYSVWGVSLPDSNNKLGYKEMGDPRVISDIHLGEGQTTQEWLTGQAGLYYTSSFGSHNLDLMGLAELRDYKTNNMSVYVKGLNIAELPEIGLGTTISNKPGGSSDATRSIGYVFRARYDYASKYLAEMTGRYDGSYLFAGSGKRWGFFPSGSVAWRMSEEGFMKNLTFLDDLKVRASVGLLGAATVNPYAFLNVYTFMDKDDGYNSPIPPVFLDGGLNNVLRPYVIANEDLTWEKTLSYNTGFDAVLWGGKLAVEFDLFYKYTYDILTYMEGSYPSSMGGYYKSWENYERMDTKGFELLLTHRNSFTLADKKFSYTIAPNVTYAKSRWLRVAESANLEEHQKRTGSKLGAISGWVAEGLYRSDEEIDNSAWYGNRPNIGDIKYKDRNGDGQITWADRGYIGRTNRPELTFGLNLGADWNGFDFNAQFTGGALFDVSMTGTYYNGYDDNSIWTQTFKEGSNSPLFLVENAYSIDNPNGSFPRITLNNTKGGDNGLSSTFWLRDGKYIRLKSAQIGYTIPKKLLRNTGITNLRVFAEGSNIFTISGLPDGIDPESPGVNNGYYPQQKTFMGGVTISF